MRLFQLVYESLSGRTLLVVMVMFLTLFVRPVNSASEPGTVTVVLNGEPENLDSANSISSSSSLVFLNNIVEPLVEINPDDQSISPRLATSWKQIDAHTWQFVLRKGVKFHDGTDFNADAVVFNIKRLYEKKINSRTRLKYFSHFVLEGKALESHRLELKTDKFEPLLLTLLGNLFICSPNTPIDKVTRNLIGTGPYKFVKWDAGTQIILERFDGYWGKQPQVKKAVYVWRSDSAVQASMVLLGEADITPNIAPQDANRPDMDKAYLNSETSFWRINAWEPPLNDRRVRLALNYAVDRNAIRGSIVSKDEIPATQIIVPNIFGYNQDLKVWPYDPKKAKQLLDEARKDGVPVDKEILLVARTGHFPYMSELAEAMMTMYRAVGLNVKLRMLETGVYNTYKQKPYPVNVGPCLVANKHDNNNGDAVFSVFGKYDCAGYQSAICDKQLDELMGKAQVAMGEERRKLWQAVFKRVHEEIVPDVMLFHMVGYCRIGKRINYKPSLATTNQLELSQITFKQ
jgi:peptide/nickel transport system substrate-binding protein